MRKPIVHGTMYAYNKYDCRCDECKQAMRVYRANYQPRSPIEHGTFSGYGYHKCRCDECRTVWNKYCREKMAAARAKKAQKN